jgi:hypothetical protein
MNAQLIQRVDVVSSSIRSAVGSTMQTERPMALIGSRAGADCIYKEGRKVCAATIRSIELDDRGVQAAFVPTPVPGLIAPARPWTSGAIWEVFCWDTETWTCACTGLIWRVFFDAALIREVKELGRSFAPQESELERCEKLIKCINRREVRRLKAQQPSSSA